MYMLFNVHVLYMYDTILETVWAIWARVHLIALGETQVRWSWYS